MGSDYISVKEFGAYGNKTNDDTAAIKAAILEAQKSGKKLFFPRGKYNFSEQLEFDSIIVEGSGWKSTVLYLTKNNNFRRIPPR
ncbi:glycoside hydrolase family 55 protein [Paenibacillus hamazuiensis]|uniref:glycoside hydrolase family 55 protein n=1 Tax=Paenibacillus hamazuiensis TaxID=2936508 RepID=UPI00200D095F|nr:glycoside hydrolase family 55 protein [Paenibacillus hamazuiensis]